MAAITGGNAENGGAAKSKNGRSKVSLSSWFFLLICKEALYYKYK
jgi:hypothetical protein